MNIECVICRELLTPSDDVFNTPCGHIFHFACLVQWLERSKTCPQCRERTTEQKIHRIFFNISNNDSIVEDPASLQCKIDNLNFQVKLKDSHINNLAEDKQKLKKQVTGLRHEVQRVESELSGKNGAIYALQDQIKFYKQQCSDASNLAKENEQLKQKLEHLKNIQSIVDQSENEVDVDDVIMKIRDVPKLQTYVTVLRRELKKMFDKSREVREKYMKLQKDFSHVSMRNKTLREECAKRKDVEDRLMVCETEKISLQSQLLDMLADSRKCVCDKASVVKQADLTSDNVEKCTAAVKKCETKLKDTLTLKETDIVDLDSTQNIPQNEKSQSLFSTREHAIKRQRSSNSFKIPSKVPSILAKKSRFDQLSQETTSGHGMSFDGFGGHAKYDIFPTPIRSSQINGKNSVNRTFTKQKDNK
ncbi:PREDICTED: E3 ubiquitin-protein ligase TRAIP-like [Vollenhovia emeryi]|uniref:E3 ubiquitin-protein ligase TRAIP-like n=1 Tax=Vollenhovia emeryi TaxID=411798 RepID=UPI0005F417DE|nr:PREDICTED: E3 ubiquitin-protein ligase TRAIP-like [Vollenhovia emeryi]